MAMIIALRVSKEGRETSLEEAGVRPLFILTFPEWRIRSKNCSLHTRM